MAKEIEKHTYTNEEGLTMTFTVQEMFDWMVENYFDFKNGVLKEYQFNRLNDMGNWITHVESELKIKSFNPNPILVCKKEEFKFMMESLIDTKYSNNLIKELSEFNITDTFTFGDFVKTQRSLIVQAMHYETVENLKLSKKILYTTFTDANKMAGLLEINEDVFDEIITVLVDKPYFAAA